MSLYNIHNKAIVVDVGNSIISFGIFEDGNFLTRLDMPSSINQVSIIEKPLQEFVNKQAYNLSDFKGGLICSVVPFFSKSIQIALKSVFKIDVPIMDSNYAKSIKMIVDNPKEVGGDILADVMASIVLYNGPCLVIDLGTITKNILIDDNNVFIGTSFFPGVQVCIDSMREKTAQLPGIEITAKPKKMIGNNSIDAMQSGVYYGTIEMIKGLANTFEKEYGLKFKKILTGGNAKLLGESLPDFIVDSELVLKGIYLLYKNN